MKSANKERVLEILGNEGMLSPLWVLRLV